MYEAFFNFTSRPFASTPQADHYYAAAAIENARERVVRCIERGEGPAMVLGPTGVGKTLLCQVLKQHCRGRFDVVMLCSGRIDTRKALLQAILYELGRPYRRMDEGELRIALSDYLLGEERDSSAESRQEETDKREAILLLVDEAQILPLRLLEEIRMLTNLANQKGPKIRLVLCGGLILEERFANPRLESFSQRIAVRCYLESFNKAETQQYVRGRIDAAGGKGESFFDAETCQAIYQAADGVPRLVNQVCEHALLMAYAAGRKHLRARDIEAAWADLQQLPTPWADEDMGDSTKTPATVSIVEFGGLDDDFGDDDEGFQPAGKIVPEIELTFGEVDNPFEEEFAQEEVVSHRYGKFDKATAETSEAASDLGILPQTRLEEPVAATPYDETSAAAEPETECEEADVLLMEKKPEPPQQPDETPPLRRHQYNQLFASLRRG